MSDESEKLFTAIKLAIASVEAQLLLTQARLDFLVKTQWIVVSMPAANGEIYAVFDSDRRKNKSLWFGTPSEAIDDARKWNA